MHRLAEKIIVVSNPGPGLWPPTLNCGWRECVPFGMSCFLAHHTEEGSPAGAVCPAGWGNSAQHWVTLEWEWSTGHSVATKIADRMQESCDASGWYPWHVEPLPDSACDGAIWDGSWNGNCPHVHWRNPLQWRQMFQWHIVHQQPFGLPCGHRFWPVQHSCQHEWYRAQFDVHWGFGQVWLFGYRLKTVQLIWTGLGSVRIV